ncbi:MAG: 1-deoxy-D-xylulose-5-phosphate synthase N-terminal domain-containing protein [Planctomycetota bacterium]
MGRLLSSIKSPRDLRQLPTERLPQVAEEIRDVVRERFHLRGGYLKSALGITDLTCALHYSFDFSHDRLIFDLAHQCAAHLVLTRPGEEGAPAEIQAPFPAEEVPPYDHFFAAHAGTSISKALGVAAGRAAPGKTVAVIGDGAVVTGVALEALNSGDFLDQDVLVILNDNQLSISKVVGSMGEYLSKIRVGKPYNDLKRDAQKLIQAVPFIGESLERAAEQLRDVVARALVPGYTFERLGPRYFGPVDGHNIAHLVQLLREIKRQKGFYLLHVVTRREPELEGRSRPGLAVDEPVRVLEKNGEMRFVADLEYERQGEERFTDAFGQTVLELAERDPGFTVVVVARPEFEGIQRFANAFRERHADRLFDIGVSEQHAFAFAAGLAHEGRRPMVVMPASFLARGLDQIVQEIALRGLPVTLALVYAGLVDDDATLFHATSDLALLRSVPGIDLLAPRDVPEMRSMLEMAIGYSGPKAIRIPRTFVPHLDHLVPEKRELVRGRGELLRRGTDVAAVALGPSVYPTLEAAEIMAQKGVETTVVNARFVRPLDRELLGELLAEHKLVFAVEEHGVVGGLGAAMLEAATAQRFEAGRIRPLGLPDEVPPRGRRTGLLRRYGLDPQGLADRMLFDYRRYMRT